MKDIADISGLAWSPDGDTIALTGDGRRAGRPLAAGSRTGTRERLTDDPYAELRPSWSPDGKTLVFATDRGGKTDLAALRYRIDEHRHDGRMPAGEISLVSLRDGVKHIDPQYSRTARASTSSPTGRVSDIYPLQPGARTFFRVTNVQTGVSGLTELSPCLSVSRGTGKSCSPSSTGAGTRCTRWASDQAAGAPARFPDAIDTPSPFDEPPAAAPVPPLAAAPYRTTFQLLSVSGAASESVSTSSGPQSAGRWTSSFRTCWATT